MSRRPTDPDTTDVAAIVKFCFGLIFIGIIAFAVKSIFGY